MRCRLTIAHRCRGAGRRARVEPRSRGQSVRVGRRRPVSFACAPWHNTVVVRRLRRYSVPRASSGLATIRDECTRGRARCGVPTRATRHHCASRSGSVPGGRRDLGRGHRDRAPDCRGRRGRRARLTCCRDARLAADPSDRTLVLVGLAMGSAADLRDRRLAARGAVLRARQRLVGADVQSLHLFPPGVDPARSHVSLRLDLCPRTSHEGGSRSCSTSRRRSPTPVLLGDFASRSCSTGAWPHSRYGELALTVRRDRVMGRLLEGRRTVLAEQRRRQGRFVCGACAAGASSPHGSLPRLLRAVWRMSSRADTSARLRRQRLPRRRSCCRS